MPHPKFFVKLITIIRNQHPEWTKDHQSHLVTKWHVIWKLIRVSSKARAISVLKLASQEELFLVHFRKHNFIDRV